MFICDKPGSIAASIAHTKSGSNIKDMLLKKLSSGGSVGSRDESVSKAGSTKDINKRQKERKSRSASNERVTTRKRCVSAITVRRKSSYNQGSLPSSKSASSTVSIKKTGAAKLMASNHPAIDIKVQS